MLTKIEFEFNNYEWEEEGGDRTLTREGRNRDSEVCFSFPALAWIHDDYMRPAWAYRPKTYGAKPNPIYLH